MTIQDSPRGVRWHYEAVGDVCGGCGHRHRTPEAAGRCAMGHAGAVRRAYPSHYPTRAYSDRGVVRSDGVAMVQDEDGMWEVA